jgi:type I restriction enzyme S subunit
MMFYRESGFQDTPAGEIPRDWEAVRLKDISTDLVGGGTPSTACKEYWNGSIAWMTSAHINGMTITKGQKYVTQQGLENSATNIVPRENLLVATRVGIGKVAVNKIDIAISQDLTGVIVNKNRADPNFLYWFLVSNGPKLKSLAQGSTIKGLLKDDLGKLRVPMPTKLSEQRAIVGVLGVVDSAIELADKVIAKTERLKKGLMQQLLTRGIGHTEYKDTPIGKTPNTWQVEKLENVAEIRRNKSIHNYEQIAFIPMEFVPDSQIYSKYEIRRKEDVKSSTYCEAGDLLLAKITPSLENGKQGIVPSDVSNGIALATTEVFPIHCKGINKLFLFYVLKFSNFRNKIISSMIGSTGRQRASKESVERLEIPVPPPDEQQRIINIFSTIDKKLELERAEKLRLEKIKKGLMDLLLTGKVRIKVD